MGQGVDDARGMFGTTLGLHKEFGAERSFDVPLAEDAMTGVGIGAALMGMRPIQVHQRMDFVLLCMNQIVNMAAKMSYMFSGAHQVPMVIRAIIGRSWGQGAQHSQAFHSYFMHIPGLRVVAPTTPHDAKGCLIPAIRDDNPVIMIEHRMLHNVKGVVPKESYEIPYGKARVLSPGKDITIVGISHMALECVRAKHLLEAAGIDAEVIDPVSLSPLDIEIDRHVGRADGPAAGGRHRLAELRRLVGDPVRGVRADRRSAGRFVAKRLGYLPTPCPTTKILENLYYPSPQSIAQATYRLVRGAERPGLAAGQGRQRRSRGIPRPVLSLFEIPEGLMAGQRRVARRRIQGSRGLLRRRLRLFVRPEEPDRAPARADLQRRRDQRRARMPAVDLRHDGPEGEEVRGGVRIDLRLDRRRDEQLGLLGQPAGRGGARQSRRPRTG